MEFNDLTSPTRFGKSFGSELDNVAMRIIGNQERLVLELDFIIYGPKRILGEIGIFGVFELWLICLADDY